MIYVAIIVLLLGGYFTKYLYNTIQKNRIYKKYLLGIKEFHVIQEDYLESLDNQGIDRETFIDLELYEVFENINFTRTTIGSEYLLGCLYHGNKHIDRQEAYINNLDQKEIKFDYLIKEGICDEGNAIAIMKQLNFDQEIIEGL